MINRIMHVQNGIGCLSLSVNRLNIIPSAIITIKQTKLTVSRFLCHFQNIFFIIQILVSNSSSVYTVARYLLYLHAYLSYLLSAFCNSSFPFLAVGQMCGELLLAFRHISAVWAIAFFQLLLGLLYL